MTPYDLMMWSVATVVLLFCVFVATLLIKFIFITLLGNDDTEEKPEDPDGDKEHKGFRRIK